LIARQDLHQGALAGAILAEKPIDVTGLEHEADAIVGADRPKVLFYITQLYVHAASRLISVVTTLALGGHLAIVPI
jgi:hypothetical protein